MLLGALVLFCSGVVWKVWDGWRAKPMVEELAERQPAVRTVVEWQATGTYVVSGVVITDAGAGAERTVSAYTPFSDEVLAEVVSDPEDGGYFELALSGFLNHLIFTGFIDFDFNLYKNVTKVRRFPPGVFLFSSVNGTYP